MNNKFIIIAGWIGLLASILVGIGESLLHGQVAYHDPRFPYTFMLNISEERLAAGHFLTVFAAPFWLIGYWHVYKMLSPQNNRTISLFICLIACYGFIIGTVWIGSRAMIASIVQWEALNSNASAEILISKYQYFMETLLHVIRATTLIFSLGFVYLVLTGKTLYPKWMALLNPFLLLLLVFISYFTIPTIGKFIMPIAMNVAQGIFFAFSLLCAYRRIR